jgi:hypothetical protein
LKFLIKIEEMFDALILKFMDIMKKAVPHFVFNFIEWLKHLPHTLKHKIAHYLPLVKAFFAEIAGFFTRYLTMIKGNVVAVSIFLKSDEFKKANKVELALTPIKKFKTEPVKSFSILFLVCFFGYAGSKIYTNTQKIIVGTKALRTPASVRAEEDPIVEFKDLKYEVLEEKELILDITLIAASSEDKGKLEHAVKEIEERLKEMHVKPAQLPISAEDQKALKTEVLALVTEAKLKGVEIKQVMEARPSYYMQEEKLAPFKNINLQLFLEDTRRNRQVWVDFTALSSNRNIVLFLKDNEVEVRDHLNMNVEPVIPQLPIEEEGRQIIKEKIRLELNEYLKANGIEGKILEVYVDYLMVS